VRSITVSTAGSTAATAAAAVTTAATATTTAAAVATTATATTTAVTTTAAATTTATAGFLRLGFIDGEDAAIVFLAVQGCNRGRGFGIAAHFHESETLAATGLAV
jgi:hypothetical protein